MNKAIPMIYEENIIEFAQRSGNVVLKYLSEEKTIQLSFLHVYAFDFVDFDYIKETDWQFGLELQESSEYIQKLVRGMSQEELQRAFGGEYLKLQHYRLVIDDVGMYNIVCKGFDYGYVDIADKK